jgi:hypothetical protein
MSNIFIVGDQVFNVFDCGSGWRLSVNGVLREDSYLTRSDAWMAGVAEVDRLARRFAVPREEGDDAPRDERGRGVCHPE